MTEFFQSWGMSYEWAWSVATIAGILLIALPLMLAVAMDECCKMLRHRKSLLEQPKHRNYLIILMAVASSWPAILPLVMLQELMLDIWNAC